jgi:molybdenum cofactor synthesis domain-containing protein
VITLSDKGSKGQRVDESGPAAAELLRQNGYEVVETMILPDEPQLLKNQLIRLADGRQVDLVLTSGGTGFSLRDQTPEATMAIADRNAPGIAEYMRLKSMEITDRGMLSRGVSVIRKKTLIVNLPGSPKAVKENLGFILHALDHGLGILRGSASECAAPEVAEQVNKKEE